MKSDEIIDTIDRVTEYAVQDYGLRLNVEDHPVIVIRGMILPRKVPVAVARGKYTINQDMKVISTSESLLAEYLQMYFHSIESWLFTLIAEAGHGTKALRTDVLLDAPILLPPATEQFKIVQWVEENRRRNDEVIKGIKHSIALLTEYRSALITAAVIGQIADLQ